MEKNNKRKKHYIFKLFTLMLLIIGIIFYMNSFPSTMKLIDDGINNILRTIGNEKRITIFQELYALSNDMVNTVEYWIEVIRDNLTNTKSKDRRVSAIILTCAAKFPSENKIITSQFGKRKDPISGNDDIHTGIDISANLGSDVTAAWPGEVSEIGYDKIYGNYIVLQHSKEFFTKYCHLSKVSVNENSFIKAEEKIGEAGSTGRSTGNHIHFEVIVNSERIDPMECF